MHKDKEHDTIVEQLLAEIEVEDIEDACFKLKIQNYKTIKKIWDERNEKR
jgi:hypothetical protein